MPCRFNGFIQESQDLQQLLAAQQRHQMAQQQQMMLMSTGPVMPAVVNSLASGDGSAGMMGASHLPPSQATASQAYIQSQQSGSVYSPGNYDNSYLSSMMSSSGQPHGLTQPPSYIQWYYHRRENILSPGYPVLQRRDKFILAADQGLVILNANEPGWYQCRLGNQIIHSYNLIIDTSK